MIDSGTNFAPVVGVLAPESEIKRVTVIVQNDNV